MRGFSRSKSHGILPLAARIAVVSALAAFGVGALHPGPAHAAGAVTTYTGTRGQLPPVGTVDPTKLPTTSTGGQARTGVIPVRARPGAHALTAGTAPSAAAIPLAHLSLLHNFDGIDAAQSQAVNNGTNVEPADEGLGVGNGVVINLVNAAIGFYRENGTLIAGPFPEGAFFHEPPIFFTGTAPIEGDGRVYYDASTNTWFASQLYVDDGSVSGTPQSHFDLAVNSSGNPLTPWTIYQVDTTDLYDNSCPCFGDYPQFGIDQFNVYISTNEFPISGPGFNGAQIYAISKSELEAGAPATYYHFGNLTLGGTITYHVQPAIAYTNPPAEYFMESLDPNGTFDHRLGVFALTNRQSVTSGSGMPYLSGTVINSETYGFPVNAQTPPGYCSGSGGGCPAPTTGVVTPDFDAMEEVEYINGHLDGALDTAITIPGDTFERDGVAWFQVLPLLAGNVISPFTFVYAQNLVAVKGEYLLYPHINENSTGTMAMAFTLGGPNTYLSAAYSTKDPSARQFSAVALAAGGNGPDNGFTGTADFGGVGRWGDYSNGEVDTSGNIWLATQYIPSPGTPFSNWGNRVFEIVP